MFLKVNILKVLIFDEFMMIGKLVLCVKEVN